jgi:hypothetical protein
LQRTIARLLWLASIPDRPLTQLPAGWMRGELMETVSLDGRGVSVDAVAALEKFFWQDADEFILWLGARFTHRIVPFERRLLEAELENLKEFGARKKPAESFRSQLALL